MQNSSRTWAIGIGIIIFVLIAVALLQRPSATPSPDTTLASSTAATSTPISTTETHDGVTGTGSFNVSKDDTINLDVPDFRAPLKFSSTIQADVKTALQNAANTLVGRLEKDSLDLKSWVDLGTVRKMGGDYAGAEKAWLFVTKASPSNPLVYNNLGDLYENFIKDYPKSEQAYLTAIKLAPTSESPYIDLYNLYTTFYKKGTSAAEDILKKGVVAAPNSIALHVELARFYKAKGDTINAKLQFEAAIAAAKSSGQTGVAEEIQSEENR